MISRITHLVCSSPVGFVVLKHSLPEHRHHFWEVFVGECGMCNFLHLWPRWTPRLLIRCFPDFSFNFCVVHDNICPKKKTKHIFTRFFVLRSSKFQNLIRDSCFSNKNFSMSPKLKILQAHLHFVRQLTDLPHVQKFVNHNNFEA